MYFDPLSILAALTLLLIAVGAALRKARPARQQTWLHKMEAQRSDSRFRERRVGEQSIHR